MGSGRRKKRKRGKGGKREGRYMKSKEGKETGKLVESCPTSPQMASSDYTYMHNLYPVHDPSHHD